MSSHRGALAPLFFHIAVVRWQGILRMGCLTSAITSSDDNRSGAIEAVGRCRLGFYFGWA